MSDIARVSQIDYQKGLVKVTLEERGVESNWLPIESLEYEMPVVGDLVRVSLDENNYTAGLCLGRYFNEENPPDEDFFGPEKYYKKMLGHRIITFDSESETLTITVKNLVIKAETIAIKADTIAIEGNVAIDGDLIADTVTADVVNAGTVNAGAVNEGG